MFQVLVLPNISVTQDDIDEYEDEPQAYIRADLEETDNETRKRHCMKFVQALSKRFPNETNALMGQVINSLVSEYEQDKVNNWHKKITLLNLLIASCIGCYTYLHGATDILTSNELLYGYIEQLVIPELQALGENNTQLDNLAILKATCIKFVYFFRNQISDTHVPLFVDLFSNYLKSDMLVN